MFNNSGSNQLLQALFRIPGKLNKEQAYLNYQLMICKKVDVCEHFVSWAVVLYSILCMFFTVHRDNNVGLV